jgi:hypothetical protein
METEPFLRELESTIADGVNDRIVLSEWELALVEG